MTHGQSLIVRLFAGYGYIPFIARNSRIKLPIHFVSATADLAVGQNLVPLVNIKIAGKWMFIPLKMVLIGIDS